MVELHNTNDSNDENQIPCHALRFHCAGPINEFVTFSTMIHYSESENPFQTSRGLAFNLTYQKNTEKRHTLIRK